MNNFNTIFSRIMGIGTVQRQSLISLFWQIALTLVGFMSTIYFAHAVGASVLGAYFLFIAYFGIISMVTDGGFGTAAVKRISEGEDKDEYFSAYFVINSSFVFIVVATLIIFRSYFVDLNNSGIFIWLLLAIMALLLAGPVSSGITGCGKIGISATCSFINNITRIIIQVISVFLGYGVAGLTGGFVAGLITHIIIGFRFLDLRLVRFGWKHIKRLSTFSFWVFLTAGGGLVFTYADSIIIGYYMATADVGVYQIVLQFTTVALFIVNALLSTLWPKVSRWGRTGELRFIEQSLSQIFDYSMLIAIPVLAGGVLLGDKLLYFFYGTEFTGGYTILIILLIVRIINIFQYSFNSYLMALDRQKDSFKVTSLAAVLNIILDIILIPVLGIAGAALATLATIVLNSVLAKRILSQIITIRLNYDCLWNIVKASAIMSVFLIVYRSFIPLSSIWLVLLPVFLGGLIFGILILKLDIKTHDELRGIAVQMNLPWPNWL